MAHLLWDTIQLMGNFCNSLALLLHLILYKKQEK